MSSTPLSSNPAAGVPGSRQSTGTGPVRVDPTKLVTPGSAASAGAAATEAARSGAIKQRKLIMGGAAGAVALGAVIALLVWRPWKSEPPRLNEPPDKIARFIASSEFESLPFSRQRTFMEHLDKIENEVK